MKSLIASVVIASAWMACASSPEIHLYTVDAGGAAQSERLVRSEPLLDSVNIRRVWGADFLELNQLVYQEPDLKVGYYHQHRWVAQPRHLIETAFAQVLREANVARYVFASNDLHASPVEVELELQQFGEYDQRESDAIVPQGRVEVRMLGVDRRGDHARLFEHRALHAVKADERTHEAVVRAINQAMRQALTELCAALQSELGLQAQAERP